MSVRILCGSCLIVASTAARSKRSEGNVSSRVRAPGRAAEMGSITPPLLMRVRSVFARSASRPATRTLTSPGRPCRAVRPARCTKSAMSFGKSAITTCDTCSKCSPREAASVATSTGSNSPASPPPASSPPSPRKSPSSSSSSSSLFPPPGSSAERGFTPRKASISARLRLGGICPWHETARTPASLSTCSHARAPSIVLQKTSVCAEAGVDFRWSVPILARVRVISSATTLYRSFDSILSQCTFIPGGMRCSPLVSRVRTSGNCSASAVRSGAVSVAEANTTCVPARRASPRVSEVDRPLRPVERKISSRSSAGPRAMRTSASSTTTTRTLPSATWPRSRWRSSRAGVQTTTSIRPDSRIACDLIRWSCESPQLATPSPVCAKALSCAATCRDSSGEGVSTSARGMPGSRTPRPYALSCRLSCSISGSR
mmetsp:Transcript_9899/g.24862  ORF Transcript_9899/g.24862 Transcript_9899/m.24862 type:complete len:430 (-) Transcript_9899:240-1529(-)